MKKYVVYVEGKGELIFTRHILIQLIGYEYLSFQCFELRKDDLLPDGWIQDNPNALVHYITINVGTDEKVLSEITDSHQRLIDKGYEIVGLRDMFCEQYEKDLRRINQIENRINERVNISTIQKFERFLQGTGNADKIHFFFAIMEFEAWLIGIYRNLERIDPILTTVYIREQLNIDLDVDDPETTIFHPAVIFGRILALANIRYGKHGDEMERIVSRITMEDIDFIVDSGRCNSLALFVSELQREFYEALNLNT